MTTDNHDPFALARSSEPEAADELVALDARWHALNAQCHALDDHGDSKQADAVSQAMVEVENRIAEIVPTSAAGAAAQLRLLRQWGRDFEWNELMEKLTDKLLVGLERIWEARS
jgi:hypothetical protein